MANKTNTGKTETLLVELLTEELPPKSLAQLGEAFSKDAHWALKDSNLLTTESELHWFATPRRLGFTITNVQGQAPDREVTEKIMPVSVAKDADGNPTPALKKKLEARKIPLSEFEFFETRLDGKTETFFYTLSVIGERLGVTLPIAIESALKKLPVTKRMRWGDGEAQFARPVHGLVMMHGARVVPGEVLGRTSSNQTLGHRFLSSGRITIKHAGDYEQALLKGKVVAGYDTRRTEIISKINGLCGNSAVAVASDALYDEIVALVEAPAVYEGKFSPEFLEVPEECLILSMQQHQKYVPLRDQATGKLLPRFLFVSNIAASNPREIVHGNERVLRARLSDAKFFYDQDRKTRLEARVPQLAKVVYHNKLGSQLERVERIKKLSGTIARELKADAASAERAAWLSKADLLAEMVGEFPELQGVMGRYYALHDGEPKEVAAAIDAHYRPRFAGDRLPEGNIACAVALADKLDALAGLFSIGGQPTGDKDPFGLRRAALGVIRIVAENQLPLSLWDLVDAAFEPFRNKAQTDLQMFFEERMRSYFHERGYTANEVEAVLSVSQAAISLIPKRLEAVRAFSALPEAASLAAANKRVVNILKQAEARGESPINAEAEYLKEPAERALFDALRVASQKATLLFKNGDFTGYLKTFSVLKSPVDAFFDTVMVMVDQPELRQNRLALLADLRKEMNRVADISKLAA